MLVSLFQLCLSVFERSGICFALILLIAADCAGQTPAVVDVPAVSAESRRPREEEIEGLKALLTGSRWMGQFTKVEENGQIGPATKEAYEISKAEKLPDGNLWMLHTRIKYGERDVTVPLPINIEWANQTPVITVDQLLVPGLGTFDARVLIRNGKYSGTWAHNDHGGHLFGTVVKVETSRAKEED